MIRNEYCEHDITYIVQPTRDIMRLLGIWPSIEEEKTLWERVNKSLLIIVSYVLISCNLVPGILYWLILGDARTRIVMIPILIYDVMSVSQYGIFIFRHAQIRRCLKYIEEDWEYVISTDIRKIMLKFARTGKRLVVTCASLMFSGYVFFRTVLPLSHGNIVTEQNITIRPLAFPSYLFYIDVQATPVYETLFTIQCVGGLITAAIVTGATGLTTIFVLHASGQLRILRDLITNLVKKQWQKEKEVNERLAEIIEHQIRIRSFLRLVQHTMQQVFLMEIMVNTINLCIIVYFIIIEWQNSNTTGVFVYVISIGDVVLHVFIYCYTGEQLTVQAEKVATVSRELEWYRLPDKKARYVILLIMMSNAPTKISAGNFFDLSLKTFANAMKTAGAYFNILRNVKY